MILISPRCFDAHGRVKTVDAHVDAHGQVKTVEESVADDTGHAKVRVSRRYWLTQVRVAANGRVKTVDAQESADDTG